MGNGKIKLGALGALLLVAAMLGALIAPLHQTFAQSVDTWSGHDERIGIVDNVTVTSTASLIPAVTGKKIVIKAIDFSADTAGIYKLQDGSGGTTIGEFYLAANTPRQVPEANLGQGIKTTSGNALFGVGPSGGKITATVRFQAQ